ncbi:MAG: winged helix-turn-helix domain-containing protein [Acidobacteriia bacterium]|nr:winged helix-turn-helix domain-containing protein [Terriglobia bacterium]
MENSAPSCARVRFGKFEVNPRTGELFNDGQKVQLHEQPFLLLLTLLERSGELVTREELSSKLWPPGTFVDFDRGLNKAVNKLRDALGDSADRPQFIETLPRKGYRFIGVVTQDVPAEVRRPTVAPEAARPRWRWGHAPLAGGVALVFLGIVLGTNVLGWRDAIMNRLRPSHLQITSLAVLPLENLSGDPEQAYFADGMTDALITEVARVGTTRVISRTTILRYKATRKTTQQIGRELNVDAVVEGTILHSGDRVRITAQLIQVSTDNHLWAESYERDMSEVLRLQQEVATDIARRIGSVVKPVEPLRTVNPEAYGEYLKGRFDFFRYTAEGWRDAIEHYSRAIQADQNFAPAYAGLAESYIVAGAWNAFPLDDGLRKGKAAAQKALELDSMLASAHLAMGEVYVQEWNHASAEKELRRALELNPNDPLAWQLHGVHLLWRGHFQEGIAEQERARSLDPFSPIINANLVRAFCYSRQYDKAIAQAQETLKLQPGHAVALYWLEHAYRHKSMFREALAANLAAAKPEEVPAIERAYRSAGYRGVLLMQAQADKRSGNLSKAARAFAQAGDREQALTSLEECYRHHCPGLGRLKVEPDFDPIRADARFTELLRRIGYTE